MDAQQVVGTWGAPAVDAAQRALSEGGSAADAALVAALAQIVLCAGCWTSFAGIMAMMYYEARSGRVWSMNGGYNAVREEDDPRSIPGPGTPSGRTALVPGFMAGVQ